MKTRRTHWKLPACLAGLTLLAGATVMQAATALNANLTLRPLSAVDVATYALPAGTELSGGLNTVGVGTAVYLEAEANIAIPPADITNVIWTLTAKPVGSGAGLTAGPLAKSIPIYEPSTRLVEQVAGRQLLRPDVPGRYTVTATIQTTSAGTTNVSQTITASSYVGAQTCALCHSGGAIAEDKWHPWSQTLHAEIFSDEIDGLLGTTLRQSCLQCHTTGFSANTNVMDGGFSALQIQYGWTIPTVLTNGNWTNMQAHYPYVAALANVQCESCHGPGLNHANLLGATNSATWPSISINLASGDCNQCHDDATHHPYGTEWMNSLHAKATRTPSGPSRVACVRCHTSQGFMAWADAGGMTNQNAHPTTLNYTPDTTYEAINCQTCHEPHDSTNPHQLRLGTNVTLSEGTVITNAGLGGFCMECHNNRDGSYTNMLAKYPLNQATWVGGSAFGTHDSPQADILEGVNAETYGKVIPSAAHANSITDTCVGCHMQPVASTDPAFLQAGGHTFKMTYTNNLGVTFDKVDVCVKCHGPMTSFNLVKADYNGDGVVEGVQTEVQHLLDKLSTLLPPRSGYQANPANYVADGLVKTSDNQMAIYTNVPTKFLKAYYNWDIVFRDGSLGIHNAPFVVGLLKASIGDLTGDANNDGLPDAWQIAYFGAGFATNAAAAPNAVNNSAGVPNWMMASLNLDPHGAFTVAGSGAIYINDGNIVNGDTNTIAIYTAAEIAFDTVPGTSYQIQGISQLTGTWSNISTNIPGTGNTISYLTPTHGVQQMFYRVVHTP